MKKEVLKLKRFNVIIGYPFEQEKKVRYKLEHYLAEKLTKLYGGCTIRKGNGYWRSDAAYIKNQYNGELFKQATLEIILSYEVKKAKEVYNNLKLIISNAISEYCIDAEWIHIEQYQTTALHFNVKHLKNCK